MSKPTEIEKLLEECRAVKVREDAEHEKSSSKRRAEDDSDYSEIVDVLLSRGILLADLSTNKYWYRFSYRGYAIGFVNQNGNGARICYNLHREGIRGSGELLEFVGWHRHDNVLSDKIRTALRAHDGVINLPAQSAVEALLDKVEAMS